MQMTRANAVQYLPRPALHVGATEAFGQLLRSDGPYGHLCITDCVPWRG
jgi:hypothetical protein